MENFWEPGMVNEFDKRYNPYSGTESLEEEMKKVCTVVQMGGFFDRPRVVQHFKNIICGQNHNVDVEWYGSSSTGLFVRESDVDLVILVPANQLQNGPVAFLTKIYNQLMAGRRAWRLNEVKINTATPIPFVKAVDDWSGLEVGIICAEPGSPTSGLGNSQWIRTAIAQYPSVTQLVVILKKLLRHNNLPNITGGGISSYALTLLVISYVQHADRQYNLGDLLLGFLELYGHDFDYENKAIVLTSQGRLVDKRQLRGMTDPVRHQLIIQDPVDPTKNSAKSSLGGLGRVREVFKKAHESLDHQVSENLSGEGFDSFLEVVFDVDDLNLSDFDEDDEEQDDGDK